ncbi:MAG: outer membrane beta-barrel protein [Gemmatimonadaceae bacterium]
MPVLPRSLPQVAALVLAITMSSQAAAAQSGGAAGGPYRPVTVWVGAAASTPISDFKEVAKSGFAGMGAVQYRPEGKVWGVRGELQYHKMDMTPESLAEVGASAGVTGTWSVLYGGATAVLESMQRGSSFGWYVLAGGGSYRVEPSVSDAGVSVSVAKTSFGFNGGGGVRFKLGAVGLYLEGRYHTVTIDDSKVTLLPVSVGLVF